MCRCGEGVGEVRNKDVPNGIINLHISVCMSVSRRGEEEYKKNVPNSPVNLCIPLCVGVGL